MYEHLNPGYRYLASPAGAAIVSGSIDKTPTQVLSAEEYVRVRTVVGVTQAGGLVNRPSEPQAVSLQGNRGNRVLPACNVVDATGEEVAAAVEGDRTEAAAPTAFGTALPEGSVSFTRVVKASKRLGVWVPAWKSLVDDPSLFNNVVSEVLRQDFDRIADAQALNGDGTGEQVVGILDDDSDVPTSALSTATRAGHFRAALATIREADHVGPIDAAIHPTALLALVDEIDENDRHTWKRELAEEFGFRSFIPTTLIDADTPIVADFKTLATAWIREPGILLSVSQDHASFFTEGKVAIAVEGRWEFEVVRPSAGVVLTGWDS